MMQSYLTGNKKNRYVRQYGLIDGDGNELCETFATTKQLAKQAGKVEI